MYIKIEQVVIHTIPPNDSYPIAISVLNPGYVIEIRPILSAYECEWSNVITKLKPQFIEDDYGGDADDNANFAPTLPTVVQCKRKYKIQNDSVPPQPWYSQIHCTKRNMLLKKTKEVNYNDIQKSNEFFGCFISFQPLMVLQNLLCIPIAFTLTNKSNHHITHGVLLSGKAVYLTGTNILEHDIYLSVLVRNYTWSKPICVMEAKKPHPKKEKLISIHLNESKCSTGINSTVNIPPIDITISRQSRFIRLYTQYWITNDTNTRILYRMNNSYNPLWIEGRIQSNTLLDGEFEDEKDSTLSFKDLFRSSKRVKEEKKTETVITNFYDYDKDEILNVSSEANIV